MQGATMKEIYRGFNLYGGAAPVSEMLLGPVTEWQTNGVHRLYPSCRANHWAYLVSDFR